MRLGLRLHLLKPGLTKIEVSKSNTPSNCDSQCGFCHNFKQIPDLAIISHVY